MGDQLSELHSIIERNKRVEADKAWETSLFRKVVIAFTTYCVAVLVMWNIGVENVLLNALIPTVGYGLSTLSLPPLKQWWLKHRYER